MLRLEGNPLQEISPYEFSPFPKLHYLNLSSTSLESCSYKAFASETENIKALDLSGNLFKTFDPQCFEGLSNLQILWMRRMPFLQSLPVDLFLYTSNLIHVNLEENSQLHFVKSSMFEQLLHLQTLSLKSCNLTEFRPWKFFTNSTITITLSGNQLVCSCGLAWLIKEPEKTLLNRANDTRCEKYGPQRQILLADFIDECDRNGNSMEEFQSDTRAVQNQQVAHTAAVYHNPSGINVKTSRKLPIQSSNEFQFSITSFTKSTNLLNTLLLLNTSSDPHSGIPQTKEGTTQNDQTWNKLKGIYSRVKTSITLPITTRDQMASELYPTTTRDHTETGPYTMNNRGQTETGTYPTTIRNKIVTKPYPLTTVRSQTRTELNPKIRDQIRSEPFPTKEKMASEPYPTTRYQTVTKPYSLTFRDQMVIKPYPTTRDQTGTEPHTPTTRDQIGTKLHPSTTREQIGTEPHPLTAKDQTGIKSYASTIRDQTETKPHLPTTREQTGTEPHPPTTRGQTGTEPHPPTTVEQTGTKPHPPTTGEQTGIKSYPLTTRDDTGTKPYLTFTNQTGTVSNLITTSDQSSNGYYPKFTRAHSDTEHYSTVTLQTTALPELSSISTTKRKGPVFILIEDDDIDSLEKEEITSPTPGDCNYDPCRHWQVPCHDLQHLTGCHCPVIAGEDVIPDPVKIQKVIKISDNSAEIYWCAPSSTVMYYYIIYQSDDNRRLYKTDTIKPTYRRYTLRDLTADSTYHTCVVAVNKAGSSTASSIWPSKGPCYIFKTKPNYNNIFYIASTVIIVILFILVIILSFLLCKIHHKGQLTNLSRISLDPLSLQNPAFDDQMELADPRTVHTRSPDSEQIL
ncbi:uncharacterized protein LOC127567695 [Pristis pectinata]|uniref:uncharacterized protein LOC127567695 n=1 Tax=Pristis pectinata TaxID=685728 RepID=UPI00223DCCDB|nr:uncharacterized protein LOC127567695 [Pristis pectinata]